MTPPPSPDITDPRAGGTDADPQSVTHPGLTEDLDPTPDHGETTYVGRDRLEGRRALITGGDSGIGRAVALAFAREGADVAFTYLPDEQVDANETVALIEQTGQAGIGFAVDIRDHDACQDLVDDAVQRLGGLDIVVNNAAYQMAVDDFADLSAEQLIRTFTTNVFATFWISQAALPHLDVGASIINTTSIQAYQPSPPLMDYAATKAALNNFTKNLSQTLAERGIRVNAVAPGPVWTPLIPATMPSEKVESFGQDTPLGRPGEPVDLAPSYVFLASNESRYITGETISVTGGRLTP